MFRVPERRAAGRVEEMDARVHCRCEGVNPSGVVQRAIVVIARCRATKSQPGHNTIRTSDRSEFHSTSRHDPRKCQKDNLKIVPERLVPDISNAQTVLLRAICFYEYATWIFRADEFIQVEKADGGVIRDPWEHG